MQKLSTGDDATLGNYRKLASAFFGNESEAVRFLDKKIAESINGEAEEVIADESQMLYLLSSMVGSNCNVTGAEPVGGASCGRSC